MYEQRQGLKELRELSSNGTFRISVRDKGTRQQKSSLRDQRLTSHGTHWRNFAKVAHKRDDRDCEVCMTVHDRRSIGGTPVDTSEQHHMNGGRPVHNGPVVQDPGFTRNTSTRVRGLRSHGRNGTSGQPQVLRRWSTYMKAFDTKIPRRVLHFCASMLLCTVSQRSISIIYCFSPFEN
nr:unnamed protein product [Haemonchus contortus]